MALLAKAPEASSISRLGRLAAALVPLIYCLVHAAPHGYLAGSLALQSASLGDDARCFALPAALLGKLCSLLPIGPLALRVALGSALALGLACAALYRSIDTLLRAQGVTHDALIAPVALGFSLLVAGTPALFLQGLRPEGFALQLLLSTLLLERLTYLEARWPSHDMRPLYTAALCLGAALGNDLLSAALLVPATVPTLVRVQHAKGLAPIARAAICALIGGVGMHLGALAGGSLADTATHSVLTLPQNMHPSMSFVRVVTSEVGVLGIGALLGAIAALQTPGVRRIGMLWVIACVVPFAVYGVLGRVPQPPDGVGMLAHLLAGCAMLAAALAGVLLAPAGESAPKLGRGQLGAALGLLLLGALRLQLTAAHTTVRSFGLLDALHAESVERLPTGALVVVRNPATAGLLRACQAETQSRPDLRTVSLAFWERGSATQGLSPNDAALRPLLRAYLLEGELARSELDTLTEDRPVLLDADARTAPTLYRALRPSHFFYEVIGSDVTRTEELVAAAAYRQDVARLSTTAYTSLLDPVAQRLVAGQPLAFALYFAAAGDRPSARIALDFGRRLVPSAADWDALTRALGPDDSQKPLDVRAFVPSAEAL